MAQEQWKDIPDYEGIYQISDQGRIRSLDRIDCAGRHLKGKIRNLGITKGYHTILLSKNGINTNFRVNRLVLMTFSPIENMEKYHVNHINENTLDDVLSNLEWMLPNENYQYGTRLNRIKETFKAKNQKNCKKIQCVETGEVYNGIREASRILNLDSSAISKSCKNPNRAVKGFHFIYKEE